MATQRADSTGAAPTRQSVRPPIDQRPALHRTTHELVIAAIGETFRIEQRLERLHDLGFDVEEMDIVGNPAEGQTRYIPRVVEHGYHSQRLKNLTGLETTENQARRLLGNIGAFGAELHHRRAVEMASTGVALRSLPENVVAVRWLDQQFEPLIARVPRSIFAKVEPAELYHQLLEHRWFLSEQRGAAVSLQAALDSYIPNVVVDAPDEIVSVTDSEASTEQQCISLLDDDA